MERDRRVLVVARAGVAVVAVAGWAARVAGSKADGCAELAGAIERQDPRSSRELP